MCSNEHKKGGRRSTVTHTSTRVVLLVLLSGLVLGAAAQDKGGEDETGPYEVVAGWPKPLHTDGWTWGSTEGVWAESPNRIWAFQRGEVFVEKAPERPQDPRTSATERKPRMEHVLMVFDAKGQLIQSWEQHNAEFVHPHRIRVDPNDKERNIWLVDEETHRILKFSYDGKLLLALGEKNVSGADKTHFFRPSDMAFLPNGDFYVADGRGNARVVKFSRDGTYLFEWGKPGKGNGEFNLPHSVAIDAQRRVYVADRSNSRIQVFDENGKYLDQWRNIRSPNYIHISKDQSVWVCDGVTNKILKYDLTGKLLYSWGTYGDYPGAMWSPHEFAVDSEGSLYIAEAYNGRLQKFRPRSNANPAELIRP